MDVVNGLEGGLSEKKINFLLERRACSKSDLIMYSKPIRFSQTRETCNINYIDIHYYNLRVFQFSKGIYQSQIFMWYFFIYVRRSNTMKLNLCSSLLVGNIYFALPTLSNGNRAKPIYSYIESLFISSLKGVWKKSIDSLAFLLLQTSIASSAAKSHYRMKLH